MPECLSVLVIEGVLEHTQDEDGHLVFKSQLQPFEGPIWGCKQDSYCDSYVLVLFDDP